MNEILLQEIIATYDELMKYTFIINRGNKKPIVIKFECNNFYHLIGLHKMKLDVYFPVYVRTKKDKYYYIKNNIDKFNSIIYERLNEKVTLKYRVTTFNRVLDMLLNTTGVNLFDIRIKNPMSLYNGEYGLSKVYEDLCCLFGLKVYDETDDMFICAPQSWMPSRRPNSLILNKRPLYIESIEVIPNKDYSTITN